MKLVRDIVTDLRERRLWPLALLLMAALVAVPVLLAKSSNPPAAVASNPGAAGPAAPALPVVDAQSTPTHVRLTGPSRNPFGGSGGSTSSGSSTSGTSTSGGSTVSSNGKPSAGGAASATGSLSPSFPSGGGSAPRSISTAPAPIVPTLTPTPAPPSLTATEAYHVTLAITNTSGGIDTIDPLERLSVLPDPTQPLLIELGVLSGGHRVLFAVEPGTVVSGPGTCTPGPIDCEILSIAPDQTEGISTESAGKVTSVAEFAVTGITVDHHASAAIALAARSEESAIGRELLDRSALGALSLFRYDPSLGYVVDLRNLTIGG